MKTEEIRKLLENGKLTLGRNETVRALEAGNATQVLKASNAPAGEVDAINDYARMAEAEVVELAMRNDQLGTACRKPFSISFIAVTK